MVSQPQLFLTLETDGEVPLNRQVYEQIRKTILSGTLQPGDRLPSSRRLAADLGVSRTVVVNAYDLLFADGFVSGQQGSATRVSEAVTPIDSDPPVRPEAPTFVSAYSPLTRPEDNRQRWRYDFRPSLPSWDAFPVKRWAHALEGAVLRAHESDIGYGQAEGIADFRSAIGSHLRLHRGLNCDVESVVITSGATQALSLLAATLLTSHDAVLVEDPTHPVLRRVFANAGALVVPVPVDERGLIVDAIPDALAAAGCGPAQVKLAYTTPTHQFPTGSVLPLDRRLELIRWARRHDVVIVEDDYDSDFTFGSASPAALAGLDPSVVVYVGTFSKSMFPALRLGFAVLPSRLLSRFVEQKWLTDRMSPTVDQLAMTEFLVSGNYESHVAKMNVRYAAKREALARALGSRFGSALTLLGAPAGLHVMALLDVPRSSAEITSRAATMGARLYPCDDFFVGPRPPGASFVFGFGALPANELAGSVEIVHAAVL